MKLTKSFIQEVTGLTLDGPEFECDTLALSNSKIPRTLSFLDDEKFSNELNLNSNIAGVFITQPLVEKVDNKHLIICDDPRYYFFTLLNEFGRRKYAKTPSIISPRAQIHPKAYVSEFNVMIGDNTVIGPHVTILADVEIGNNCIIQPGVVVGSEGFEYKRTSKGIVSVFHDGKVVIGNRVEIGANTCVDKGFSFRQTIIEDEVKIDNLVHIAHGVQIGKGAYIIASCMLGGSVTIKENVWIGPNASIAPGLTVEENGFVTLGSVATRNVSKNEWVTGNFAIPHQKFLRNLKKSLSE